MEILEYALYKGDECLSIGTLKEIAKEMNVSTRTIKFYGTPTYKKRGLGEKSNNRRILIKLEADNEL